MRKEVIMNSTGNPKDVETVSFAKKTVSTVFEWLETVILAFCFVAFVFTFMFKVVTVSGPSMNYTLYDGQKLIISSMFYTPERGDIVVIDTEKFDEPIIKRIIALEGDTVEIDFDNWVTTVTTKEGKVIEYKNEPYVNTEEGGSMGYYDPARFPLTVGEGEIFVMGDNRRHSTDSRSRGCFRESEIIGKAIFRVWPMEKIGFLH